MPTRARADLDDELVARGLRWCAEAGGPCSEAALRLALRPLSWDQLLNARALLADPPGARPLGPFALADIARGDAPEVAAERQRAGRYDREAGAASAPAAPGPARARRVPAGRGPARRDAVRPTVRRVRDRPAPPGAPPARALPCIDTLFAAHGKPVLEQLLRDHGARRAPLVAALARGFVRGDGSAPGEVDLDALLEAHALARAFEHRERDELLHALRAAGGQVTLAASGLGLSVPALAAALSRLAAEPAAEAIRAAHRDELRRRATLGERTRLLLTEGERLSDLGLVNELEADLRARLPGHVRALRASAPRATAADLAESLSVGHRELAGLLRRMGLTLDLEERPRTPVAVRAGPRRGPATRPGASSSRPADPARRPGSKTDGRRGMGAAPKHGHGPARGAGPGSSGGTPRPATARGRPRPPRH